jgi:CubicO group peptidase (beta-lactamase class C family)
VQRQGGTLSTEDIKYLTFRSGYTSFSSCLPGNTVQRCVDRADNGVYTAADDGRYAYGGGHMQKHASLLGLGPLDSAGLATEIRRELGSDIGLSYSQPQLAGGVVSTAADYARFLRKLLAGGLRMGAMLGSQAVCTNPLTCPTAISTPVPATESWHYSLGHWVEDDPAVGDGAFSSAGAFGFYPWIDAGRTWYGIVAREGQAGTGVDSVYCGRLIRKAWLTGTAR